MTDKVNVLKVMIGFILIGLLQGCADVAMTSAQVFYNRKSLQKNLDDHSTTKQIYQALYMDTDEFKGTNIAIATYNGEVLLAGQTPFAIQREKAGEIVKKMPHIKSIYNVISLEQPSSTAMRMNDAWVTTKIKAKLLTSSEVDASRVKVVTENGVVFLMGILPPEEAAAAVSLARETSGVRSVVKIFSYLHINKNEMA